MQFQPPSQPGWPQSESGQYSQPQTGYPQWQGQPQQPYYPPQQQPNQFPQQQQWQQPPMMPMQPQQPPKKKTGRIVGIGCGALVALVILIAIIAAAAGNKGTGSPSSNSTTPAAQTTATTAQSTPTTQTAVTGNSIGKPVADGAWTVTINSVALNQGDSAFSPSAGHSYLVIDMTLVNSSSTSQVVSSLISFVFKDSTGQSYTESVTDIGKPPDGTVQAGDKLRGQIVYEVPVSQHRFTLVFQGDLINGNTAIWTFNK